MTSFPDPKAAYVHVPFCVHRCGYCDFTLVANRDDLISNYLDALELEMQFLCDQPREIDTLFFGGGTPTQLSEAELTRLFEIVSRWFTLSETAEVSVEANPDGLSPAKVEVLASAGINRVSLGAQSFDGDVLRILERKHDGPLIHTAVERIRKHIQNISIDLIFGVPNQSVESWENSLQQAIGLNPQHVSTYGLTFEKGTAFWSRKERGDLMPAHNDIEHRMYELAIERLGVAGFQHYELSNFARQGFRCRHNETYWSAMPYYAFGPGAARYVDGRRETNHRSVFTWLKRVQAGDSPIAETETLTPVERAHEAAAIGLRKLDGIHRDEFQHRFGISLGDFAADAIKKHIELGNLHDDGQTVRLTQTGRFVADSVVVDFL